VAPTPAPAPAPGGSDATITLLLTNPGAPYTAAQRAALIQLLANEIGATADPTLQPAGRRHLLATEETIIGNFENVPDCGAAATKLQAYIDSAAFEEDAAAQGISVSDATIISFVCNGEVIILYVAPAPAPAPVSASEPTPEPTPASGPGRKML
jgi:hypothetical protein